MSGNEHPPQGNDLQPSIMHLDRMLLDMGDNDQVRFGRIFHVSHSAGHVYPPEEMLGWIEEHFGDVDSVREQHVIKVTNLTTMEGAVYNTLRALRPVGKGTFLELPSQSRAGRQADKTDPFCNPETETPEDGFGRIRGKHSVTASNVAKFEGHHGLVIFDEHDPLKFTKEQVSDYFDVAWRWAERVFTEDPQSCYYFVMWNCLWKAAASMVHGHMQVTVTSHMHYAKIEALRRAAMSYRYDYGFDYFKDLFDVHQVLGLGFTWEDVRVMAYLTPVKEKETIIIGEVADYSRPGDFSENFKEAIYHTLDTFVNRLGVVSFNLAVYVPPAMETAETWAGFPLVARVVDRGGLEDPGDMGAMELYAASVITSDPFEVAARLREGFQ